VARQARKRRAKVKATEHVLSISELGWHGDGVAEVDGKKVYVPFTLAGESVRAAVSGSRAVLLEILQAAPERVEPACPHFSRCGGCAVQHLATTSYTHWKRQIIVTALANRHVEASVAPLVDAHGAGRRRVTLHVRYEDGQILAGFMQAGSHKLIDLDQCPILAPELSGVTTIARDLARALGNNLKPLDIQLTATETGLDCAMRGGIELDLDARMDLSDCANDHDLARLTLDGELVLERRAPILTFGAAKLALPPGGFLQATKMGEEILSGLVLEAVGKANKVADLYCGVGPFALRLAQNSSVVAIDSDSAAIAALKNAADHTPGQKPVVTEIRDLAKNPLYEGELISFDVVVFDPPRAGAEAQVLEIVEAKVKTVVAVSCNPATFAHDASILTEGGYVLEMVIPVDQFRYAGHVEMVGVFKRKSSSL
jgi:23S rRNA (uracil1939-C5)-methyltransferase